MLAIIFLIFSVCWLIVAACSIWLSFLEREPGFALIGIGIILVTLFLNSIPLFSHINNMALIRNAESLYEVREQAIDRVSKELELLPGQTALMNADSPAKTLIETKSKYVTNLAELQMLVARAKVSVERRKMGPGAWAVWFIGE